MLILVGKPDRMYVHHGQAVVSFIVPTYQGNYFETLDPNKEYKVQITEVKSKRTLQQNKYMWKLIHEIAKATREDSNEVYCNIIKMAKIETVIIQAIPEALEYMVENKTFRVVIERDRRKSPKGVDTIVAECYWGTSKFDVAQMNEFIEQMLDYATTVGVDLSEYGDVWQK